MDTQLLWSSLLDLPHALSTHPLLSVGVAGVFGVLIGSFLNVVILRLPPRLEWSWRQQAREFLADPESEAPATEQPAAIDSGLMPSPVPLSEESPAPPDLVFTPSHCMRCGHRIRAWENIPVVSFLLLRGRCSGCAAPLSWQYPLVELFTAITFATLAFRFGLGAHAWAAATAAALLIALAGIDARTQLLPDQLSLPFLWLGLIVSAASVAGIPTPTLAIVGAILGYGSLWSIYWAFKLLTGKEGMGYGDFKLLAGLGVWCGPKALIPIALLACVLGVAYAIVQTLRHGSQMGKPFAFGPYLAMAGLLEIVWPGWFWTVSGIPS